MSESGSTSGSEGGAARAYQSATRSFAFVMRQPSWVFRFALIAAAIVLLAVLAVILIPAIVVGLLVFALGALTARVRRFFGGSGRKPIDADEGRKNVRVIVPSDAP